MDLSLDLTRGSPTYGDLLLVQGDVPLTGDVNAAGTPAVLQNILQRLRLFRGEWFLNKNLGVPYFQQVLVKNPNLPAIDNLIHGVILATPGVLRLTQYSLTLDKPSRVLSVSFTAVTTAGVVSYEGPLNTASYQVTQ